MEGKEGDKIEVSNVLLVDDGSKVSVGKPNVPEAKMIATIQSHVQGDRIVIFKKKRRKGYRVKNGHRQQFTMLKIDSIVAKGMKAAKPSTETLTKKPLPAAGKRPPKAEAKPKEATKPTTTKDITKAPEKKSADKDK